MTRTGSNYEALIEKLDGFIRKYYLNRIIRGFLYTVGVVLALFILISVAEYYFYFGKATRKLLFYSFVGISFASIAYWIMLPALKYFRLGKRISHEQAAAIIGRHFSDIEDKLINILQLKARRGAMADDDLVMASINQKAEKIKLIPFRKAIDLRKNKKYLKYSLPPLLLLLLLLLGAPSVIKDSTKRLVENNKDFERPAPFHFQLLNDQLRSVQFETFDLLVGIEGKVLPNEVFIDLDGVRYRLKKEGPSRFSYRFHNLQDDVKFRLTSGPVVSRDYELKVLKKPNILGFDVVLDYPAYTGRKDERLPNMGDLTIPQGTVVKWVFNTDNTDAIRVRFGDQIPEAAKRQGADNFYFSRRIMKDVTYTLFPANRDLPKADSVQYRIAVIPDMMPAISVKAFPDTTNPQFIYLTGDASDDYGLTALTFNYKIKHQDGSETPVSRRAVLQPDGKNIVYDYVINVDTFGLQPGDELIYFFETTDNDRVNGPKTARTQLLTYHQASIEELKEKEQVNNEEIEKALREARQNSSKMREEMRKIREKLLDKKEISWQEKKDIEKLLERQKELQQQLQQAREQMNENLKNQKQFSNPDPQLLEKQEKLKKLFDEALSDEMKELMQQIEELLQDLQKEDAIEKMEDYELSNEELEQELDRMEELFKQLKVEKELQDQIKELEKLAEEQEKLAKQTEENPKDPSLEQKQEELNKKFDELKEKQKQIQKDNKELQRPMPLEDQDEEMEDIQQDMDDAQQQLQQNQGQNAPKSQKSAARKMKKMANQLSMSMQAGQAAQNMEDIKTLRQILENLVTLSYDQEDLMNDFDEVAQNTPRFKALVEKQFVIKEDFQIVEDSLRALAKRNEQIESFVMDKISDIKTNIKNSLANLEERKVATAQNDQHATMKDLNDLALMLAEAMEQMQQEMSAMMPGNQACSKPGQGKGKNGKVPMDKITQGQKQLNEQMKQMLDRLKKGKGGTSKEFAKMAAKQAALREALRRLDQDKQGQGQGDKMLQEIIKQMDEIETKLVNKQLDEELLKRQAEIETRLLEAEHAERQRKQDQKRKSRSAQQIQPKMPPSLEDYIKKRKAEVESFKTVSPALRPYYKVLVEQYIDALKQAGHGG